MSNKGRDIRTFFQPSSQPRASPAQARPAAAAAIATSSRKLSDSPASSPPAAPPPHRSLGLQLSSLPSSPQTPQKSAKKSLARTDEIKGSDDDLDDDGEDSDSSVESLSAIFGLSKPKPSYGEPTTSAASIGGAAHESSLLPQQTSRRGAAPAPKQTFDMKALLAHARQDEKTAESARRAQELIDMSDDADNKSEAKSHDEDGNLQDKARALLDGGEDENGDKLVRAIDRTKSKPTRRCCYFFNPELSSSAVKGQRASFPYDTLTGCWKIFQDPATRDQSMIHHIPHTLVSRGVQMPEELLLWILGEICAESNAQLRLRYCDLVGRCGETAGSLVTTEKLYSMLQGLGGAQAPKDNERFSSAMELEEAYARRDWGPLRSFLLTLAKLAPYLGDPADAILLLLRMSLDPVCVTIARREHAAALEALVASLPESSMLQNTAKITAYLNKHIDEAMLKVQAVNAIPKTSPRLRSLWRGVAQRILFGHESGEDMLSLDAILQRLGQRDFAITQSTDFEEYKSLVTLLDGAIGNGAFLRLPPQRRHTGQDDNETFRAVAAAAAEAKAKGAHPQETKADANRRFDAAVDALTRRIEVLQNKIHDSNSAERKEAKTALDALAKRLAYSVRTRPPPKTSIFDENGNSGGGGKTAERARRDEVELPRQRDFMKGWTTAKRTDGNVQSSPRLNAVVVDGETGQSHRVA